MTKLGVVMDDLAFTNPTTSTSFALLLAAQQRNWTVSVMRPQDLWIADGQAFTQSKTVRVQDCANAWFSIIHEQPEALVNFDILLMRQDPPVNSAYLYASQILDLASQAGVLVSNHPSAVRDCNEKLFATWFPEVIPKHIVASDISMLANFLAKHPNAIAKALDSLGGMGIYKLDEVDAPEALLQRLTQQGNIPIMLQQFIPEIKYGDKRILLINGKPEPDMLARIPNKGDFRGNLAQGATAKVIPLGQREKQLCEIIAPVLRKKQLHFVGLDVIGDYITEINVTSPTGVREIDKATGSNIAGNLLDLLVS